MKKFLFVFVACMFAVCGLAKDINVLISEWSAIASGDRDGRIEYVKTNANDIATAYPQWVKNNRNPSSGGLFSATFWHTSALDGISDYEAVVLSPFKLYKEKTAENPNWYDAVKSGGFKIDGVQLSNSQIFDLARFAGDSDVVESVIRRTPMSSFMSNGFDVALRTLRKMNDAEYAREKLLELQEYLVDAKVKDSRIDDVRTALRIVREKCLDAKTK